jgi:hypothetical protein
LRDGDPAPLSGFQISGIYFYGSGERVPNASSNLAYAPRTIRLGFRLTFQRYPGRR